MTNNPLTERLADYIADCEACGAGKDRSARLVRELIDAIDRMRGVLEHVEAVLVATPGLDPAVTGLVAGVQAALAPIRTQNAGDPASGSTGQAHPGTVVSIEVQALPVHDLADPDARPAARIADHLAHRIGFPDLFKQLLNEILALKRIRTHRKHNMAEIAAGQKLEDALRAIERTRKEC